MDKLSKLKLILMEDGDNALLTDNQLIMLLQENDTFEQAVYNGFILKSQSDGHTLPDGSKLDNNREYWLTLAKNYRPSNAGTVNRADDFYLSDPYGRCRK